jgi:hypothetical protein
MEEETSWVETEFVDHLHIYFRKQGCVNLQLGVAIVQRQKAAVCFSGTGKSWASYNCHQLVTCGSVLGTRWSTFVESMIEPPFSYA